jgi:hypothetical protein
MLGQGLVDNQFAARTFRNGIALVIDHFRQHTEEWKVALPGLVGVQPGKE